MRGINVQRLLGSQRALKSVEDFTEFEQRATYLDGDPVIATKKGGSILERGSPVQFMAEFQSILDSPPAPKLNLYRRLDPGPASLPDFIGEARGSQALVETERRVDALRGKLDRLRRSREKVSEAPPLEWIEERLAGRRSCSSGGRTGRRSCCGPCSVGCASSRPGATSLGRTPWPGPRSTPWRC